MHAEHQTILIVGGGLAGLACARHLTEGGQSDFLLISEDIGGRTSSSCDRVNFGAFYVRSDYRHVWPLMTLRRRFNMLDGCLIDEQHRRHSVWSSLFRHPVASIRFASHLARFDRHLQQLMRRAETCSMKNAVEADPYIHRLYHQPASEYLKEHGLAALQNELIAPALRGHVFLDFSEIPAIVMFRAWMAVRRRAYECSFNVERLTRSFSDRIVRGRVIAVRRIDNVWEVRTAASEVFLCDILVMATTVDVTKRLVNQPEVHNGSQPVNLILVDGQVKPPYGEKTYTILPMSQPDVAIVRYDDGTHLVASNRDDCDLSDYFQSHRILETKRWEAPLFIGSNLVESKRSDSLYLIGDFVLGGMEMAYLTGKYAAFDICQANTDNQDVDSELATATAYNAALWPRRTRKRR